MKIAASNVALGSAYELRQSISRQEHLHAWADERQPAAEESPPADLIPSTRNPAPNATAPASCSRAKGKDDESEDTLDARTLLLKRIIEKMFGGKFSLAFLRRLTSGDSCVQLPAGASSAPPGETVASTPAREGWGLEYQADEVSREVEQLRFAAAGVIQTSDGQKISFELALMVQQVTTREQHLELKAGDARIDPLVLNFDGAAAELVSGRFDFDLEGDGETESLPLLGKASAFLALDRDGDGQIDDGSELFGPATGNGFGELDAYDDDRNGWIDENDAVYSQLRLWRPSEEGAGQLSSLAEESVGAIYLDSVVTPLTYKDAEGQTQAVTSATGVFLQENGTPGAIQELDYTA